MSSGFAVTKNGRKAVQICSQRCIRASVTSNESPREANSADSGRSSRSSTAVVTVCPLSCIRRCIQQIAVVDSTFFKHFSMRGKNYLSWPWLMWQNLCIILRNPACLSHPIFYCSSAKRSNTKLDVCHTYSFLPNLNICSKRYCSYRFPIISSSSPPSSIVFRVFTRELFGIAFDSTIFPVLLITAVVRCAERVYSKNPCLSETEI